MKADSSPDASKSKEGVALAAALIGCPSRNMGPWLEAETHRRVAEAKALGASDAQASEWAGRWGQLARGLITALRR